MDFLPKSVVWKGEKKGHSTVEYPDNTTLARWPLLTSRVISYVTVCTLDLMRWKCHYTAVVFLPKSHNPSSLMREIPAKSELKDILQNIWPVFFKTVKILRNKESLRHYRSQEGPKVTGWLNVMWYPGWILEDKRGIR